MADKIQHITGRKLHFLDHTYHGLTEENLNEESGYTSIFILRLAITCMHKC